MSTSKIYKIYYKANNKNELLGYLSNIQKIYKNITSTNINNSISLYDFTNSELTKSYIYLTNKEYINGVLYVIGFWFSVNDNGTYTLFHMLNPNFVITVKNNIVSFDSVNINLTDTYNMIAIIFDKNKLIQVVVNNKINDLANPITITEQAKLEFVLGNDNGMKTKLSGKLGNIILFNANHIGTQAFTIDILYNELNYRKTEPTTTTIFTKTTTTATEPDITEYTTTTVAQIQQTIPEQTTPQTTIFRIAEPEIDRIIIGDKPMPTYTPNTTTVYTPTTTKPPIIDNVGELLLLR